MDYKNYNPRAAALAQARALLTDAVKAAVADGALPEAALPDFIVEIPADVKNGDIASNVAMAGARAFHKAPRQIAEAFGVQVHMAETPPGRMQIVCSLYEASCKNITVHSNILQTVSALLPTDPDGPFNEVSLTNMAIAHELFHHLEEITPTIFTRTFRITLWQLGPLKNTSGIPALSEIGAFAFAKSLCRLPFYPALINLILLYSQKPEAGIGYYSRIKCSL